MCISKTGFLTLYLKILQNLKNEFLFVVRNKFKSIITFQNIRAITTKLTLTIEAEIIEVAKKYATELSKKYTSN